MQNRNHKWGELLLAPHFRNMTRALKRLTCLWCSMGRKSSWVSLLLLWSGISDFVPFFPTALPLSSCGLLCPLVTATLFNCVSLPMKWHRGSEQREVGRLKSLHSRAQGTAAVMHHPCTWGWWVPGDRARREILGGVGCQEEHGLGLAVGLKEE